MSDLRERVARALCSADAKKHGTVESVWKIYLPDADAAIAIVLEEAARCVRRMPSPSSDWMADELLRALGGPANQVPAAIRALATK